MNKNSIARILILQSIKKGEHHVSLTLLWLL
jgi:hypothetical protein